MNLESIKEFLNNIPKYNFSDKGKIYISISIAWIILIGYLTWWNGLRSLSLDKTFRSIKPTVDAFCDRKFNAFQSLLIKLFFFNKFLTSSKIYLPLASPKADSPITIIGLFADNSFSRKCFYPSSSIEFILFFCI